jgi:flagellar motor switch protein FliM
MTAARIQSGLTPESLQGLFRAARGGIEQLPALRQALEQMGSACIEELRRIAAMPFRLTLEGVEAGTFEGLLGSGGVGEAIAMLEASAWEAQLFVCADRTAVFAIVEAMLGGDGSQPPFTAERALSGLEADLAGVFFGAVAKGLAASFAPIAASPFCVAANGDEVDVEAMGPAPVVVARYRLEVMERGGAVLIAIPQSTLEMLRKPLTNGIAIAAPKPDPGWSQQIRKEVTRANVTLTAILDERMGLLAEVLNLAVGQIIELNATPQSRVRVECNGESMALCDLGKSNGIYTLRVDSFIDREQEFMDDILAP